MSWGLHSESPIAVQQHQISEEIPLRLDGGKGKERRETKNYENPFSIVYPRISARDPPTDLWDSTTQRFPYWEKVILKSVLFFFIPTFIYMLYSQLQQSTSIREKQNLGYSATFRETIERLLIELSESK